MKRARIPAAAAGLVLAAAPAARAHGREELALLAWLAGEPHMLRITAAILGGLVLLFGLYALGQARRELAAAPGGERESPAKMIAPGIVIAAVGAGMLLAAWLLLPVRLELPHGHPPGAGAPRRAAPRGSRGRGP